MPGFSQAGSPAVSCEGLARLTLPNATITMVQTVAAGELKLPGGPTSEQPGWTCRHSRAGWAGRSTAKD